VLYRPRLQQSCLVVAARSFSTHRLHGDHVLGACLGQLDHLQQRLLEGVAWLAAGAERQQDDVEPGEQERQPPRQKDQQEPNDCADDAWTQAASAAAFTSTHCQLTAASLSCRTRRKYQ